MCQQAALIVSASNLRTLNSVCMTMVSSILEVWQRHVLMEMRPPGSKRDGIDACTRPSQEAPAWLTAPPRPAPPVLMPPRLAGGAEELRAEGTGQEILLQVSAAGQAWGRCWDDLSRPMPC